MEQHSFTTGGSFEEPKKRSYLKLIIILGFFLLLILGYAFLIKAPRNFPQGKIINIEKGMGLRAISLKLKNENVISSRRAFEAFVMLNGGDRNIIASDFYFENRESVFTVARRIAKGQHGLIAERITIPEGKSNSEIADILSAQLPLFNKEEFLTLAQEKQGYLFPDTYFFFPTDSAGKVVDEMSKNYQKKVGPLKPKFPRSERDIINMAALLEKEAKGDNDRNIISGILWKRYGIGMPLQADAAPETYQNKGLPKSPIGNPGIEAIEASMSPESSPYLYYIHDKEGVTHYAKTFAEHRNNIERYLKD